MLRAFTAAMRHLREQGAWVLLARIFLSGGAFVSSVVLARIMSLDEMGLYSLLRTVIATVGVLALPGAMQVILRNVPLGTFGIYKYLYRTRLKCGVVSSFAFLFYICYVSDRFDFNELLCLGVVAALIPPYFASQNYVAARQALMQFRELSWIQAGETSLQLMAYILPYLIFQSVIPSILCMMGVVTAFHSWNHRAITKYFEFQSGGIASDNGRHVRDAALMSVFLVLPAVAESLDRMLIENRFDLEILAVYTVGVSLGSAVNGFFKPFLGSISALLVSRKLESVHYLFVYLSGTLLGCSCALFVPFLLPRIYGLDYTGSVVVAQIFLWSMGLFFWKTLYLNYSMYNKKKRLEVVYLSNTLTSVIAVIYMILITVNVEAAEALVFWLAMAYPFKLVLSIVSLGAFGRFFHVN